MIETCRHRVFIVIVSIRKAYHIAVSTIKTIYMYIDFIFNFSIIIIFRNHTKKYP